MQWIEILAPNAMADGCKWFFKSASQARRLIDQGNVIVTVMDDEKYSFVLDSKEYRFPVKASVKWITFVVKFKHGGEILSAIEFKDGNRAILSGD